MFSKVSIRSFVYDLIDVFDFPNETVNEIYCKNSIIKCHLQFSLILFAKKKCGIVESESRSLIFEILK